MNTHTHTNTPGPWHLGKRGGNPAIYGKDGTEVAEILHGLTPEWRANARLIAAAPEMLAALQSLTHPMASDEDLQNALAVIAKAKGGDA
jgi:hypothetical protein